MFLHPQTRYLILVESDDDTYPYEEKQRVLANLKQTSVKREESMETEDANGRSFFSRTPRITLSSARECVRSTTPRPWYLGL